MQRTARAFTGLGLGVIFAFFFEVLPPNIFHDPAEFYGLFGILNFPAEWLAHYWSDVLQLPPRGEIEYVLVQDVTKGLQWAFIGILGGVWWGFALRMLSHPQATVEVQRRAAQQRTPGEPPHSCGGCLRIHFQPPLCHNDCCWLSVFRSVRGGVGHATRCAIQEVTNTSPGTSNSADSPYEPPIAVSVVARRTRFPALVTGLIGLAMGAGFYGVLCGFLLIAWFVDAPGIPTPRERVFMIAAAVFHVIPLTNLVSQCRNFYKLDVSLLWMLAIACWLLMRLSGEIMILNLGI